MANGEQLQRLLDSIAENNGCAAWNQWRKEDWDHEEHEYQTQIDLSGADLSEAHLSWVNLMSANLSKANLSDADLHGAHLSEADLSEATIYKADLSGTGLSLTSLRGAILSDADLSHAFLRRADLSEAIIIFANFSGADLNSANLSGADLNSADLSGADLERALMSSETSLDNIKLDMHTHVLGVRWNGAPLDNLKWSQAPTLGDEPDQQDLAKKSAKERVEAYRQAARAYHGLAVALRLQGLDDDASHYHLQEMKMRRKVLRYDQSLGSKGGWLLSVILGAVAAHGEQPGRAVITYFSLIIGFAFLYFGIFQSWDFRLDHIHPIHILDAFVFSFTSFHGRGFFPGLNASPHDPQVVIAAAEAVMGLFIELIFIATFSRRFLGD